MFSKKVEEAGYIKDLHTMKESLYIAIQKNNRDNLWSDAASSLPENEFSPSYLDMMMGFDEMEITDDNSPSESIDNIREYMENKIEERIDYIIEFLKSRIETVDSNIKYLEKKFKKNWNVSWENALMENEENDDKSLNLDDILDKINKKGISSLTKAEKNFLDSRGKKGNND